MSIGEYNWVIEYYQLSRKHKLATIKSFKADISSVSPLSGPTIGSDEGLMLKTSALKLFTVANLCYQLS